MLENPKSRKKIENNSVEQQLHGVLLQYISISCPALLEHDANILHFQVLCMEYLDY